MARNLFKRFNAIILAVAVLICIHGSGQEYRFRHLTAEDGLPTNYCWAVLKDSRGFVWITSRAGICRYDGYNVKVFQYDPEDSVSLSDNRITFAKCIAEDSSTNLWIGTYKGLNRYDPVTESFIRYQNVFSNPQSISSNWITCLYVDRSGTLWIGTAAGGGLNRYLPDQDGFISYGNNPVNPEWKMPWILAICEDRYGVLWLGTSSGVYQFDRKSETFREIEYVPQLPGKSSPVIFKFITEDRNGILFAGTQYGFLTYDRSSGRFLPLPELYDESIDVRWLDIIDDPYSKEYTHLVINSFNLYRYNIHSNLIVPVIQNPKDPSALAGMALKSIYRDESGILWLPGEFGVNILDPLKSAIETHEGYIAGCPEAESFYEDSRGGFWIGSDQLARYNDKMELINIFDDFPIESGKEKFTSNIWSLTGDRLHNIWIGTDKNGLYLLPDGSSRILRCNLQPNRPIFVYDILEDSQGIVWVGTDGGLFHHRPGESPVTDFHRDSLWGPLIRTTVLGITEDRAGNLWIGTTNYGLFRQPKELRGTGRFVQYIHDPGNPKSLSNDWAWSIYQDNRDNLWIATEDGLNRYDPVEDNFDRYYNNPEPASDFIYDLVADDRGILYMTTENGLIRFNPADVGPDGSSITKSKKVLPFNEIFPYKVFRNRAGKIFTGVASSSEKGYLSFHPDSLKENRHIPPVSIVDFKVKNEFFPTDTSITLKKHIVLNFNQNFISFGFVAMDYTDPSANRYAYMLEGLDEDWIYCNNQRFANYTGLLPGDYIFRVKGSNNDGYWNESGASISITILPPPWKTWWAYTLYGLVLLILLYSWRRYDLKRQHLKKELEIEHIESEKLKELDSMKSRFFTNISHEFRTPLTLILGPLDTIMTKVSEEVRQDLEIMQRNAYRLQRLIDQLLSLSRLEAGQMKLQAREENIVSLVNGYTQSFESLGKQKGIELAFSSDREEIPVYVDREKIEKILFNLLSNAFKFTPEGGQVAVTVGILPPPRPFPKLGEGAREGVVISISDTGPGIAPGHLSRIFDRFYQVDDSDSRLQEGTGIGLALTKEMVELHRGIIMVESEVSKGTTFKVYLPLGKGHLKEEEIDLSQQSAVSSQPRVIELETWNLKPETQNPKPETEKSLLLIVEDNADLRLFIRGYFEGSFRVLEAKDGEEGLAKSVEKIPDLVISDVMMPGMDGFELTRKLKTDERTSHIPVILLTARAGQESRIEGLETGADDFIIKPFDPQELTVRTRNLIRQRQVLREKYMKDFMHASLKPENSMTPMEVRFMEKVRKVLEENLFDPDFTILEFSNLMSMSRVQLHRKLSALLNLSATDFLRTYRLNKAAQLLSSGSGNVAQVAYEVGFNNLSYFSKCFRKQFGVLPSEYLNLTPLDPQAPYPPSPPGEGARG